MCVGVCVCSACPTIVDKLALYTYTHKNSFTHRRIDSSFASAPNLAKTLARASVTVLGSSLKVRPLQWRALAEATYKQITEWNFSCGGRSFMHNMYMYDIARA